MELSCGVAGRNGGGGGSTIGGDGGTSSGGGGGQTTATPASLASSSSSSSSAAAGLLMDGECPCEEDYECLPTSASLYTHMTAGAVAGILEHTVMYPVDSVKTRMQSLQPDPKAQYRSVFEALRKIVHTEGLWRPLRGINVTVLGAGPAHALYFACYEKMKRTLSDIIQHGGNSHLANGILT